MEIGIADFPYGALAAAAATFCFCIITSIQEVLNFIYVHQIERAFQLWASTGRYDKDLAATKRFQLTSQKWLSKINGYAASVSQLSEEKWECIITLVTETEVDDAVMEIDEAAEAEADFGNEVRGAIFDTAPEELDNIDEELIDL